MKLPKRCDSNILLTKTSAALGGNFLFTAFTVAEAANLLTEEAIFNWHLHRKTPTEEITESDASRLVLDQ